MEQENQPSSRRLAGVLDHEKGEVILGKDVTRAYFAQHQFDILRPENTVFEELLSIATDESQTELRTLLGTFLFSGDEIEKKVSVLSGGEKSRLILAKMLLRPANFLLFDEPTSHLDIPSKRFGDGTETISGYDLLHHPRPPSD